MTLIAAIPRQGLETIRVLDPLIARALTAIASGEEPDLTPLDDDQMEQLIDLVEGAINTAAA